LRVAGMAPPRFIVTVSGAALVANIQRGGGQQAPLHGAYTGWQLGLVDTIGAALVVDQAARAELGDGNEPRPLPAGAFRTGGRGGHIGIKRKAREIVAGEEALGREIAIGIEVGPAGGGTTFQQRDLFVSLRLLRLRLSPLLGGETMHLRAAVSIKE